MKKIVIIGAGPSGISAAINCANKDNEIIILERNNKPLKKLLLTGNGKCNYYNSNQDLSNYNSTNKELVSNIINDNNLEDLNSFFDRIGLVPKIKNGYYYPNSNTAYSVYVALLKEVELNNITIKTDYYVSSIKKVNDKFLVNDIECDYVIVSTGSNAYPNTGSDGNGYNLLKELNHSIIKPLPSLTSLIGNERYFKNWSGLRLDAKVSHYEDNVLIDSEVGEIQLTDYGVSGICVFNLSGKIKRGLSNNKKEEIRIDFLPNIDNKKEFIEIRNNKLNNRNIMELLEGLINYKLLKVIFDKNNINENKNYNDLTDNEKELLINDLSNFKLNVVDSKGFENSQVCSGGVSLEEVDLNTMESKLIKGLYIVGELVDIDGKCGGYNLTNAFLTGLIAGKSINAKD